MFDRIRLAFKVLFVKDIIVVTRHEQFSTFTYSYVFQDDDDINVMVKLTNQ